VNGDVFCLLICEGKLLLSPGLFGGGVHIIGDFVFGLLAVIKVTGASLLYRYPHRISGEALRSDWLNIGKDIDSVIGRLEDSTPHGSGKRKQRR
jgi:hypothetical protein